MNKILYAGVIVLAAAIAGGVWGWMVPKAPEPKITVRQYEGAVITSTAPSGSISSFTSNKDAKDISYASAGSGQSALFRTSISVSDIVSSYERDLSSLGWTIEKKMSDGTSGYIYARDIKKENGLEVVAQAVPGQGTEVRVLLRKLI